MKIRIATYNIHKGVSSLRNQPRIHALKQAITKMEADVIFLQEVQGRHDKHAEQFGDHSNGHVHWPKEAQHEFLAGASHHCAYGMNAMYDHGHHGNALLSAFPIASMHNRDVSDHAYEKRGILHCVLQTTTCEVHCYVVHLGLFAGGRLRQTDALIEAVSSTAPPGSPVIIAGDFNDWRNDLSATLRTKLDVTEVFDEASSAPGLGDLLRQLGGRGRQLRPARTFPAAFPWLRLDRIYVRGFKVESAQVMHGVLWAKLSDHAPIVANLVLK